MVSSRLNVTIHFFILILSLSIKAEENQSSTVADLRQKEPQISTSNILETDKTELKTNQVEIKEGQGISTTEAATVNRIAEKVQEAKDKSIVEHKEESKAVQIEESKQHAEKIPEPSKKDKKRKIKEETKSSLVDNPTDQPKESAVEAANKDSKQEKVGVKRNETKVEQHEASLNQPNQVIVEIIAEGQSDISTSKQGAIQEIQIESKEQIKNEVKVGRKDELIGKNQNQQEQSLIDQKNEIKNPQNSDQSDTKPDSKIVEPEKHTDKTKPQDKHPENDQLSHQPKRKQHRDEDDDEDEDEEKVINFQDVKTGAAARVIGSLINFVQRVTDEMNKELQQDRLIEIIPKEPEVTPPKKETISQTTSPDSSSSSTPMYSSDPTPITPIQTPLKARLSFYSKIAFNILIAMVAFIICLSVYYRIYLFRHKRPPFAAPLILSSLFPAPDETEIELEELHARYGGDFSI